MRFFFIACLAFCGVNLQAQTAQEFISDTHHAQEGDQHKKALELATEGLEKYPNNGQLWELKGLSFEALGKFQEAYETYTEGLAMVKDPYLYLHRGIILDASKEFNLAIADYTAGLSLTKNDTLRGAFYNNRASSKMGKRDHQGAYEDLMMVYEKDSTNISILVNLGVVCDEIGRGDETLKYLYKAIEVDSTMTGIYVNIGFKLINDEKFKEAVPFFDKALAMTVDDIQSQAFAYSNRSFAKLKSGDLEGAMTDVNKSIEIYSANSYAYRNRALIYIEMGKTKKACKDLDEAIMKGFTLSYGQEVRELQAKHCN